MIESRRILHRERGGVERWKAATRLLHAHDLSKGQELADKLGKARAFERVSNAKRRLRDLRPSAPAEEERAAFHGAAWAEDVGKEEALASCGLCISQLGPLTKRRSEGGAEGTRVSPSFKSSKAARLAALESLLVKADDALPDVKKRHQGLITEGEGEKRSSGSFVQEDECSISPPVPEEAEEPHKEETRENQERAAGEKQERETGENQESETPESEKGGNEALRMVHHNEVLQCHSPWWHQWCSMLHDGLGGIGAVPTVTVAATSTAYSLLCLGSRARKGGKTSIEMKQTVLCTAEEKAEFAQHLAEATFKAEATRRPGQINLCPTAVMKSFSRVAGGRMVVIPLHGKEDVLQAMEEMEEGVYGVSVCLQAVRPSLWGIGGVSEGGELVGPLVGPADRRHRPVFLRALWTGPPGGPGLGQLTQKGANATRAWVLVSKHLTQVDVAAHFCPMLGAQHFTAQAVAACQAGVTAREALPRRVEEATEILVAALLKRTKLCRVWADWLVDAESGQLLLQEVHGAQHPEKFKQEPARSQVSTLHESTVASQHNRYVDSERLGRVLKSMAPPQQKPRTTKSQSWTCGGDFCKPDQGRCSGHTLGGSVSVTKRNLATEKPHTVAYRSIVTARKHAFGTMPTPADLARMHNGTVSLCSECNEMYNKLLNGRDAEIRQAAEYAQQNEKMAA
ncbi:unnamed protein product, partial [Chrysoparadoxa australica]